jgi:vanillate O-demethylase monooxygenase subunit
VFAYNAWYAAGWSSEITNKPLARRLLNQPLVLYRGAGGKVGVLEDRCCHRALPLALGEVDGDNLRCGYHGLLFDAAGRCVEVPFQDSVPSVLRVRSYPVVERDELVWVWMGDPALADPSQVVRYPFHGTWPHKVKSERLQCNYLLISDNLLDQSHAAYVHKSTLASNSDAYTHVEMRTEPTERGVRFTRWMLGCEPPGIYARGVKFAGKVDRWQEFEYVAPSCILQYTGAKDAGKGAYEGNRDGGFGLRIFYGITPETQTTSWFFWSVANGHRQDDPRATEELFHDIEVAFKEDEMVLIAQEERLRETGERRLFNIHSDKARVMANRALERMIADEQKVPSTTT